MKTTLIVHHCDNDGYGAAAIIANFMGSNNVDYIEANYAVPVETLIKNTNYQNIFFVDYSISTKENATFIYKLSLLTNVIWIDHHKTSIDTIENNPKIGNIKGYRVIGISGTGLCWIYALKYLTHKNSDTLDKIVSIIEDHTDTYKEIDIETGSSLVRSLDIPKTLYYIHRWDIWDLDDKTIDIKYGLILTKPEDLLTIFRLPELDDQFQAKAVHDGSVIRRYVNNDDEENRNKNGFPFTLVFEKNEYVCFGLNTNHFSSLAFGDLIDEYDILVPFAYNGKTWTYSLYTNKKNIDCSIIAKQMGGGGHKQAAGFTIKDLIVAKNKVVDIK